MHASEAAHDFNRLTRLDACLCERSTITLSRAPPTLWCVGSVVAASSSSWTDPGTLAALFVAGGTLALAAFTGWLALWTRRSVRTAESSLEDLGRSTEATVTAATAAESQASAARVQAQASMTAAYTAQESLRREVRPFLLPAWEKPPEVTIGHQDTAPVGIRCDLTLRNEGGLALIEPASAGPFYNQGVASLRVAPEESWIEGWIEPRIVPHGASVVFTGGSLDIPEAIPVPGTDTAINPTIYVLISTRDQGGNQDAVTFVCIRTGFNEPPLWRVVGMAVQWMQTGERILSGDGWSGFGPYLHAEPWPVIAGPRGVAG